MSIETRTVKLSSGSEMPMVGIGSFDGFNHTDEELAAFKNAMKVALAAGYRLVDCADAYGNEGSVGEGLQQFLKENKGTVDRSHLFLTSKVFVHDHQRDKVREAVQRSLRRLKTSYLDLYLIHWPVAMKKDANGKDVPAGIPLIETWRALEEMVEEGIIRSIGVSNFSIKHLEEILSQCRIKPAVNQVECNPLLNQAKLLEFCKSHGIVLEAYSPLGKSGSKYHIKSDLLGNPELNKIAEKHGVPPALVCLKWQIQRGVVVIPKSVTPERIRTNINIGSLVLSDEDMQVINGLHTGFRLVCPPFMKFED